MEYVSYYTHCHPCILKWILMKFDIGDSTTAVVTFQS
jgi:hypothetical protein